MHGSGLTARTLRELGEVSVKAGITLAEWFAHEAIRVYDLNAESPAQRKARDLVAYIRRKGGRVTPRQLQKDRFRKYPTAEQAGADLQTVVDAGLAVWEVRPHGPTGGHSARECVLLKTPDRQADTSDTRSGGEGEEAPAAHTRADTRSATDTRPDENGVKHGVSERVSEVSDCLSGVGGKKNPAPKGGPGGKRVSVKKQVSAAPSENTCPADAGGTGCDVTL
jgi:hypothetical protein